MRRASIWDFMDYMQKQMDSVFGPVLDNEPFFAKSGYFLEGPKNLVTNDYRRPLLDMNETEKEVVATLELPGVDKKDIQINAIEGGLEVKVEKSDKHEEKKDGMYHLERTYSGFYRYIPTPDGVDIDNIKASYNNGVLELKMPKVESKKKAKQITID